MVTQPTYLKNLKEYARSSSIGTDDELDQAIEDLTGESDRGAVILSATSIEDTLEWALMVRMTPLQDDATTRNSVFGGDGFASTFASKTTLAYALGIIDKQTRDEINLIRDIRNACAHSRKPISFKLPELKAVARHVLRDMWGGIKDHEPLTLRHAFVIQCTLITQSIITGKRQTPLEAFAEQVEADRQEALLAK